MSLKLIATFLAWAALATCQSIEPIRPIAANKVKVLCVGINQFHWIRPPLSAAFKDAKRACEAFKQVYGVPNVEVLGASLANSTKRHIWQRLLALLQSMQPDEVLVILVSSHGFEHLGKTYFATSDTVPTLEHAAATSLSLEELAALISMFKIHASLVVTDSCRTKLTAPALNPKSTDPSMAQVQAAHPGKPAHEIENSRGLLMGAFADVLWGGIGDPLSRVPLKRAIQLAMLRARVMGANLGYQQIPTASFQGFWRENDIWIAPSRDLLLEPAKTPSVQPAPFLELSSLKWTTAPQPALLNWSCPKCPHPR